MIRNSCGGVLKQSLLLCVVLCSCGTAKGADRIALVIGNSDYEEISALTNPRNDAEDVAERLRSLGFTLHGDQVHHDLNERALLRVASRFAQAADGAEVALLYFAGHGMQFNGDPHLLPVDIPDDSLDIVRREAVGLNDLLANLAGRAELTVAIFDACREIPSYRQQIKRATRGGSDTAWRGLSRPKVQLDSTLIAFSGGSGELVADGSGRNSPYTELLLDNLAVKSLQDKRLDVPGLFAEVSYQFRVRHNGQRPEVINQGVRPNHYYLARLSAQESSVGTALPGNAKTDSNEYRLWQSAESGDTAAEYRAYLKRYPDGLFADIARARIEVFQLREPEPIPTKGRLTVKAEPLDARVRIMNIVPRYRDGIELNLNRSYDIYVTKDGYLPWRQQVELTRADQVVTAVLVPASTKPSPNFRLPLEQDALEPSANVAIVVGVGAFDDKRLDMTGVGLDVDNMHDLFESLGYSVLRLQDVELRDLENDISDFLDDHQNIGNLVFYFSGHGSYEADRNYLLLSDARLVGDSFEKFSEGVVYVRDLADRFASVARKTLLLLDAILQNPLVLPDNVQALVAHEIGQQAYTKKGGGLFTMHLYNVIKSGERDINLVFEAIAKGMSEDDLYDQIPRVSGVAVKPFRL